MKWSMALRGQEASATFGSGGRFGGTKAQCSDQFAPWSIHCLSSSICWGVSRLLVRGGGMRSEASCAVTRAISSLSEDFPGTTANPPPRSSLSALSLMSRRSFALRSFSSGPWQRKQLSERMGRICRLKSMAPGVEGFPFGPSPLAGHGSRAARTAKLSAERGLREDGARKGIVSLLMVVLRARLPTGADVEIHHD